MRVIAFIDGFNLYHAIHDLRKHHYKWVDLWQLCSIFCPPPDLELRQVFYFTAFATWRPASYKRHRDYVTVLRSRGVTPVLGRFKEKDRECFACGKTWTDHEEKETDVNLAVYLIDLAYQDAYDRALLFSGDSDLVPAVRLVKRRFPKKSFRPSSQGDSRGRRLSAGSAAVKARSARELRAHPPSDFGGRLVHFDE